MKLISNLLKPKWENSNPEVRLKAIEGLDNLDLLIRISKNDEIEPVRKKAAERAVQIHLNSGKPKELLFHLALNNGASELAEILIHKEFDFNFLYDDNRTPLMTAIGKEMDKIALLLIDNNVNINQNDKDGSSALLMAIRKGKYEIAEKLINKGADINFFDKPILIGGDKPIYAVESITTPLLEAVGLTFGINNNVTSLVELLLKKGADPNLAAPGQNYGVPLIKATVCGNKPVIELLLRYGADLSVKDKKEKTALKYAEEDGKTEIVNLLKNASSSKVKTNTNALGSFIKMIERIEQDIIDLKAQNPDIETDKNIFRQCMRIREIFRKANELMRLDSLLSDSQRATTTRIWNLSRDIVFAIPERINDRELLDSIADEVYNEIENNLSFNN